MFKIWQLDEAGRCNQVTFCNYCPEATPPIETEPSEGDDERDPQPWG